jgi:outer membrane receptor protein involved in Fe transport
MKVQGGLRSVLVGALASTALIPVSALAQGAEVKSEAIDEILVTANKRTERITDIPIAITAIGTKEIQDRGAVELRDMQYSVPGLNIQEATPGTYRIQLRGINAGAGTGLPVVGTYVDEVGITIDQQQRDGAFPLVDIERVEVLRGPQGTLYGEGAMAGTIRYITKNPSLDTSGGFVEGNLYQQNKGGTGGRINGAFGVPIVKDRLGLRISGGYDELAGWIDYPIIKQKDANQLKRWFFRPKLYAQLSENSSFSLLYQYFDQKTATDNYASIDDLGVQNVKELFPGKDKSHLANAILDVDLGGMKLTNSVGYQARDLEFNTAVGPFRTTFATDYRQLTLESRLASDGNGPFQYIVGGWYRDFKSNINRQSFLNGTPNAFFRRVGDDPVDSKSYAFFGDLSWQANEKLKLGLGGRYYSDKRSSGSTIPLVAKATGKFDAFSPRVTAKYEFAPQSSVYATVSKGFRSGGFNGNGSTFGPEALWNYEVGTKARIGAVFIDVGTYYSDYSDRQAQAAVQIAPGIFQALTRNVGKASGFGIEGAINARLGGGFEIDATAAWNNIKADETNVEVRKGERFDFVAPFTGSVALSQRFDLTGKLTGMWRIDYQHSDSFAQRIRQPLANGSVVTFQSFKSVPQDYLNARVGVETAQWSVSLDAKNILNEDALIYPAVPLASLKRGVHATPRSFGITFRAKFGE